MAHLRMLGGAVVEVDDEPVGGTLAHRHSLALLALLALAQPGGLPRGRLVGLLWPDSPESKARNRLSTLVHRVRDSLGADALRSQAGRLTLDPARVGSDLADFESALDRGEPAEAIEHYRGPFLDGFRPPDSHAFELWMDRERDRIERRYREALEALADTALDRQEPRSAARWLYELARRQPFDSGVTVRLMEALEASGNRAAALRTARDHAALLRREFGTEPDELVQGMTHRLRTGPDTPTASRRPGWETLTPEPDPFALAVLPFEALGHGDETGVFASGLHHDLLTRLSREKDLRVISRTSVLGHREAGRSIPEIARILGVGVVVEGAVQQIGARVRLNVQLIDVSDDVHLWAETYDRELTARNLFDLQSELAERITGSLRAELMPSREEPTIPTTDLEAYRLQAQGRSRLDERTEEGMRTAVRHFEEAILRDPTFAPARVGLADALILMHEYGYEPADPALGRAEEAVRIAIDLDERTPGAHASLGLLHEARQDGPAAIRELGRAIQLQPGYADAHNWSSWTSQLLGRAEAALAHARRAVELNPLSAESVSNLSVAYLMNREVDSALAEARRAGELQPDWNTPLFYEALALFELGRFQDVIERLEGLPVPWVGRGPEAAVALSLTLSGDWAAGRKGLHRFEEEGEIMGAGLLHAAFGDVEKAFRAFESVDRWDYWHTLALHHYFPSLLDPLRRMPRFRPIRERAHHAWGLRADGSFPPGDGPSSRPDPPR